MDHIDRDLKRMRGRDRKIQIKREGKRERDHCKPDFMSALAHPLLSVQQF